MLLSPIQSREKLAAQGGLRLMKEDDYSLDFSGELQKRIKFVLQSYEEFEKKINRLVNFPQQQKKELLKEINDLSIEFYQRNPIEDFLKALEGFSSKVTELEAIDSEITTYVEKFRCSKHEIDAEGLVVDAMADQYKKLNALVVRGFEKINGFNPLQKNDKGECLTPCFIQASLDTDLDALKVDLDRFKHNNHAILMQRERDRNRLKEEVASLKLKTSPFLADSSDELVSDRLDDLGKYISELDIRVEKNINDAKHRLQELQCILDKCTLSSFLNESRDPISRITGHTAKLNQAGKIAHAKATAFSSILKQFDLIKACANSSDFVSAEEMVEKVQVLKDEIRKQRDTLAQYRGITFFRPLMRCLGKGEVKSLKYVSQLEHAIEGFNSRI